MRGGHEMDAEMKKKVSIGIAIAGAVLIAVLSDKTISLIKEDSTGKPEKETVGWSEAKKIRREKFYSKGPLKIEIQGEDISISQ